MQYSGGKAQSATEIAKFILSVRDDRTLYVEPFVGGGSTFKAAAPLFPLRVASDYSEDLILLWRAVAAGWVPPDEMTEEEYQKLRHSEPSALRAFAGFALSFGGKWFGGYARSSVVPNYAATGVRGVEKKRAAFAGATAILQGDYANLTPLMASNALVYCDPPYANTIGYAAAGAFDHERFWQTVRDWTKLGALVLVSEYVAPDDMTCVWGKARRMRMHGTDGQKTVSERLFTYRP